MASEAWIESAAREHKPGVVHGFGGDDAALAMPRAADGYEAAEQRRAARLLARECPAAAEPAGLAGVRQRPAPSVAALDGAVLAGDLLALLQRGETERAKAMVRGLGRLEAEALRAALKARREDR